MDDNCDGSLDAGAVDKVTSWEDSDGDGYGNPDVYLWACSVPSDHVLNDDDCDDSDSTKNPDIDWYTDADADGFGDPAAEVPSCAVSEQEVANADDCDDTDAEIHPLATEVCDEYVDNDCNGLADEEDPGLELRSRVPLFLDADSDGWGAEEYVGDYCPSSGIGVEVRGDCDDSDASVNPDRLELPDETDQNCDGEDEPCRIDADNDILTLLPLSMDGTNNKPVPSLGTSPSNHSILSQTLSHIVCTRCNPNPNIPNPVSIETPLPFV